MRYFFEVKGTLPNLNDIIAKAMYNRFAYGSFKKEWTEVCAWSAKAHRLKPITKPIKLYIRWVEKNNRRDLDNVAAGQKFILDGLVKAEIIPNDTRRWITGFEHAFPDPDPQNPRVEVFLEEVDRPQVPE